MTFTKIVRNSAGVAIAIGAMSTQLTGPTAFAQTLPLIQPANVAAPGTYVSGYGSAGYYPNLPLVNANPRLVEDDVRTDTINYSPQTGRSKGNIFYTAPINRNLVDPKPYLATLSPAHRAQYDSRAIGYAGVRQLDAQNRRSGYRIITGSQGSALASNAPQPAVTATSATAAAPVNVSATTNYMSNTTRTNSFGAAQPQGVSSFAASQQVQASAYGANSGAVNTSTQYYEGQTGVTASGQQYVIKRINGRLVRVIRYPVPVQIPYGMTVQQYEQRYGIKFGEQQAYTGGGTLVNSYTAGYQQFNLPAGYTGAGFGANGAPITVQEYRLPGTFQQIGVPN